MPTTTPPDGPSCHRCGQAIDQGNTCADCLAAMQAAGATIRYDDRSFHAPGSVPCESSPAIRDITRPQAPQRP